MHYLKIWTNWKLNTVCYALSQLQCTICYNSFHLTCNKDVIGRQLNVYIDCGWCASVWLGGAWFSPVHAVCIFRICSLVCFKSVTVNTPVLISCALTYNQILNHKNTITGKFYCYCCRSVVAAGCWTSFSGVLLAHE